MPILTAAKVGRSGNPFIDSLTWGTKWVMSDGSVPVVPVRLYTPRSATSSAYAPLASEVVAVKSVAESYSGYINLKLEFAGTAQTIAGGITFTAQRTTSLTSLGSTTPLVIANRTTDATSLVNIYRDNSAGKGLSIIPGGKDYATYLHEFGHALGLAHPHDTGGALGTPSLRFAGVTMSKHLGAFNLNQGIYTIMGYNDGWVTGPLGKSPSPDYGYQKTLMALDIIALQAIYGANMETAKGNNVHALPDQNVAGTGYSCIWDAGGYDTIKGATDRANMIDLRAATGQLEVGGGGYMSYASGIHGGVTIAKGVVIENATGGNLNDTLIGNDVANVLTGGRGADVMTGGAGADRFVINANDTGETSASADVIKDFTIGQDLLDLSLFDANPLTAALDHFTFRGTGAFQNVGDIRTQQVNGETLVLINLDSDASAEAVIKLSGLLTLSAGDILGDITDPVVVA